MEKLYSALINCVYGGRGEYSRSSDSKITRCKTRVRVYKCTDFASF